LTKQKVIVIPITFISVVVLFDEEFEYGDGANFEVMLGEIVNHEV
jgi:hypothetical protein